MCTWVQHPNLFGQKCALIQSNVKKFANQPNVVDFPSLRAYLRKLLLCSKAFSDEGWYLERGGGHLEHIFSFISVFFSPFPFYELAPLLSFSMRVIPWTSFEQSFGRWQHQYPIVYPIPIPMIVNTLNGKRRTPWAPGFLRHCDLQQKSVKESIHVILAKPSITFTLVEKTNWVKKVSWQLLWWSSRCVVITDWGYPHRYLPNDHLISSNN